MSPWHAFPFYTYARWSSSTLIHSFLVVVPPCDQEFLTKRTTLPNSLTLVRCPCVATAQHTKCIDEYSHQLTTSFSNITCSKPHDSYLVYVKNCGMTFWLWIMNGRHSSIPSNSLHAYFHLTIQSHIGLSLLRNSCRTLQFLQKWWISKSSKYF
jgi:hypothetical protein